MIRISYLFFLILLASCSGMKNISTADPLYTGNSYDIVEADKYSRNVIDKTNNELSPKPNEKFLWMRPALARYNMISDSARTKDFWKRRISPPTTLSQINPDRTARIIENRLFHSGYFNSHVSYDTVYNGQRKAGFEFHIELNDPHRLGRITFPDGKDTLSNYIRRSATSTLLKSGDIYSLQVLKDERSRLDDYLKENGYIYFNPDFLNFQADSTSDDGLVHIVVEVKLKTPPESRTQFSVERIFFLDDELTSEGPLDTFDNHPYYLITADSTITLATLKRGLFIEPDKVYRRSDRNKSTDYLNGLPIIRAASSQFIRSDDSTSYLDALIYLNKHKRFAYSAEFNAIFRSTNYFGPGVVLSFTDRNTRRSAERFQVNLRGRFEVQIADGEFVPAYEVGLELNYTLPRLVLPFWKNRRKIRQPHTRLSTGYTLFNRTDLYRLNSLFMDFSYLWRRDNRLSHSLHAIDITYTNIPEESQTDAFKDYLEENPGVRRSFEEQFVVGSGYEVTLNTKSGNRGHLLMRLGLDAAGNLLDGIYSLTGAKRDTLGRHTLFGVPFSQFVRVRQDVSYTLRITRNSQVAARFVAGIGVPYRNSRSLPYIRQFYVGGTNSLRSFIARSIGPGGEVPPDGFRDLTGDLRLEWNGEYRFTIDGILKGALFVDAGNIWLFNEDEDRPDGVFRFSTFGRQLAVSSGFGIRLDFDFVVARLDLAYTIRRPYEVDGSYWVKKVNLLRPTFNIAIGYPF